jgi:hypothetical protein
VPVHYINGAASQHQTSWVEADPSASPVFKAKYKSVSTTSSVTPVSVRPEVRVAGPLDSSEVYRLLLLGCGENAIFPPNFGKVALVVERFLNYHRLPPNDTGMRGIIAVIGPSGGHLEAISMLHIGQYWYSDSYFLEELIVFVDPTYRKPQPGQPVGHGSALLDWNKSQSTLTGLPLITGVLSKDRTDAKERMYARKLQRIGAFFIQMPADQEWHTDSFLRSVLPSSAAA